MSDFSPAQHPRNDGTGEFVAAKKDPDTVSELGTTPYPTARFSDMDRVMVDEDGLDGLVCYCGNDSTKDGFGEGDANGKLVGTNDDDAVTSVCHDCGRVWLNEDFDEECEGHWVAPIARFDPYSDEFQDAQVAYWLEWDMIQPEDAAKITRRVRPASV